MVKLIVITFFLLIISCNNNKKNTNNKKISTYNKTDKIQKKSKLNKALKNLEMKCFKDCFYNKKINKNKLFSLYSSYNPKYLNLFGYEHGYNKLLIFKQINDISKLKNLEILKINIDMDSIEKLSKLVLLKELYLSGSVKKITIPYNLKNLYLYNLNINNFSFLGKSNIEYLEIITKNYNDKKWNNLKKNNSKIKIEIKNLLYSPIIYKEYYDNLYNTNLVDECIGNNKISKLYFKGPYIDITYCQYKSMVIQNARKNNFCLIYKNNTTFLKDIFDNFNINFNSIYNRKTVLDCAIEDNNLNFINYLKSKGAKRACEILKTKCEPIK